MKLQKKIIFLFLFFYSSNCLAQNPDTTLAYRLLREADILSQPPQQQMDMAALNNLLLKNSNEAMQKAKVAKAIFEQVYGYECAQVAEALHYMGRCYLNKGGISTALYPMAFDSSLIVNREALTIRNKIFIAPNIQVGNSYLNIGVTLKFMGRFDDAIVNFINAFEVFNLTIEADNPKFMMCYGHLNESYMRKNTPDTAAIQFLSILQKREKKTNKKTIEIAFLNQILGSISVYKENYMEAINYANRGLEALDEHHQNKELMLNLHGIKASCYKKLGDSSSIQRLAEKDIIANKADDPIITGIYSFLASYYNENQLYDEGIQYFLKVFKERNSILKPKSLERVSIQTIIADFYFKKAMYKDAIKYIGKAISSLEDIPSNEYQKGFLHAKKLNYLEKIDDIEELEKFIKTDIVPYSNDFIEIYTFWDNYFIVRHQYLKGFDYFTKLLEERKSVITPWEKLVCFEAMGDLKAQTGDFEEAIKYYRNIISIINNNSTISSDEERLTFIGLMYFRIGWYSMNFDNFQAIESFEKANVLLVESSEKTVYNKTLKEINNGFLLEMLPHLMYQCYKALGAENEICLEYVYIKNDDNPLYYKMVLANMWEDFYSNPSFDKINNIILFSKDRIKDTADIENLKNNILNVLEGEKYYFSLFQFFDPPFYYLQIGKAFATIQCPYERDRCCDTRDSTAFYYRKAYEVSLKYFGEEHFITRDVKRTCSEFFAIYLACKSSNINDKKLIGIYNQELNKYIDYRFPLSIFFNDVLTKEDKIKREVYKKKRFDNFIIKLNSVYSNINDFNYQADLDIWYSFFIQFYLIDIFVGDDDDDDEIFRKKFENKIYSNSDKYQYLSEFLDILKYEKLNIDYKDTDSIRYYIPIEQILKGNTESEINFDINENRHLEICANNIDIIIKVAVKRAIKLFSNKITKNRVSDSEDLEKIIALGIEVNQKLYARTKDNKYQYKIFEYLEANKAKVLRQVLNQNNIINILPDSIQEKLKILRKKVYTTDNKENFTAEPAIQKIHKYEQEYKELIESITKDYYCRAEYSSQISINHIQQNILKDNNTSIVNFYFNKDSLYTILINKDAFEIYVTDTIGIQAEVNDLLESIKMQKTQFIRTARSLYQKLIAPIDAALLKENLIINPDGILNYIPFEVLLKKNPEEGDELRFWLFDYLGNTKTISYDYVVSAMRERKERKNSDIKLLALAPFYDEKSIDVLWKPKEQYNSNTKLETLKTLPESKSELEGVVKYFSKNTSKLGLVASLSLLKDSASYYNLIHINSHGRGFKNSSFQSYIAFKTEQSFDKLYVRDIYKLNLDADLVTLSACETSVGNIEKGEGVISIARAFSYAGAKSVATSLWEVNESSTTQLMTIFYQNLSNGLNKNKALQEAKNVLKSHQDDYSHPYYWSGFIIYGDTSALNR